MTQNNQPLAALGNSLHAYDITNRDALGIAGHRPTEEGVIQNIAEVKFPHRNNEADGFIERNREIGEEAAMDLDKIETTKLVNGLDEDQNTLDFVTTKKTGGKLVLEQILSLLKIFQELGVKEIFFNKLLARVSQNKT